MNIFALDADPALAAQDHSNAHVIKMILETAQLLCTAHHCSGAQNILCHIRRLTRIIQAQFGAEPILK
jgi:hypothetical protein